MAIAQVGDNEIYYEIHGDGPGFPAVLIMGLVVDANGWERQLPAVAATRRTVILDNLGVGRSSKPRPPYSTDDMADHVAGVMEAAGIARAHVAGASLGGAIAQKLALRHPRLVRSLSLLCTFAKADSGMTDAADQGAQAATQRQGIDVGLMMQAAVAGSVDVDPRMLFKFLMPMVFSSAFRERERDYLKQMYERALANGFHMNGVAGQVAAAMAHDTRAQLATIGAPTLVMTGTRDKLVNARNSRVLADGISGAKLVEIEGAPHGINLEHPEDVNRTLIDWFAAHD